MWLKGKGMVSWQVTAKTIYCEEVDDEVTILVYQDFSMKCTGHARYGQPDKETLKQMKGRGRRLERQLECAGPDCPRVTGYKEKLLAEEAVSLKTDSK